MADSVKERVGEAVAQAKGKVKGGPPVATDAEGRVAVVRDALQAFGDGDFESFLGTMTDEVGWEAPEGGNFPGGGSLSGREEIEERFLGDVKRSYETFGFAPETYLESEDRDWVVVIGEFKGEGLKAQAPLSEPAVQLWEFEQGKVAAVRIFADSAVFPGVVEEEDEQEDEEGEESSGDEAEDSDES
jgi:ketosteroid isomerase-like protein